MVRSVVCTRSLYFKTVVKIKRHELAVVAICKVAMHYIAIVFTISNN